MTEEARIARNRAELKTAHPVFRARLALVLAQLQAVGFRPRIQVAWRSPHDQQVAFDSGHSHVTWGYHNATAPNGTPEALAADVLDDDAPLNPRREYLLALAHYARNNSLTTGIEWDLPANVRVALHLAISKGEPWEGKIGYDPCHVEWQGITIQEARAGVRPMENDRRNA